MKRRMILALILAILTMNLGAYAMPVTMNNRSLEATAVSVKDGSEYALNASSFQLLGTDEDGAYLIYADEQYLKVDRSVMQPIVDTLGVADMLPFIGDYKELTYGNRGEDVLKLQENLQALGYLSGTADGDYGGQSQRAVSAMQRELGLEETDVADPLIQMLAQSMTGAEVSFDGVVDPSAQYDVIAGKTEVNLDKVIELGMSLSYDDIYGVGMISNGAAVSYAVPATTDIDARTFNVQFGLSVAQASDGLVSVAPVMDITCEGTQRPVMQSVTIKSGDERYTLPVESSRSSISGLNAVEKATVALSNEAAAMLANVADEGELKIRIECKYDSYDIIVPADMLGRIADVGAAAQSLNQ